MDWESARPSRTREGISERREEPLIRFAVAPEAGRLREVLRTVDWELVDLERSSVERVRLILSEILVRSITPDAPIGIEIFVLSETIRIELSGPSLALPEDLTSARNDKPSFPTWLLTELADSWGIDHRAQERGIWLLIERGVAPPYQG
jgi:hypothetical protein